MYTGDIKLILHAEFSSLLCLQKKLFQFLYVKEQ